MFLCFSKSRAYLKLWHRTWPTSATWPHSSFTLSIPTPAVIPFPSHTHTYECQSPSASCSAMQRRHVSHVIAPDNRLHPTLSQFTVSRKPTTLTHYYYYDHSNNNNSNNKISKNFVMFFVISSQTL